MKKICNALHKNGLNVKKNAYQPKPICVHYY